MKKPISILSLNKETISQLTADQQSNIKGGQITVVNFNSPINGLPGQTPGGTNGFTWSLSLGFFCWTSRQIENHGVQGAAADCRKLRDVHH